jgi:hypothetical protein
MFTMALVKLPSVNRPLSCWKGMSADWQRESSRWGSVALKFCIAL